MEKRIITIPVADLRAEPNHRSERVSQVIFGHEVKALEEKSGFLFVECEDGYQGWMAESYCDELRESPPRWLTVASRFADLNEPLVGANLVLPLTALVGADERGEKLLHPVYGYDLAPYTGDLAPLDNTAELDPASIADQLMGIPYLWGGTSTFGFDCSGLTQTVFRQKGVLLPRDSKDQALVGQSVEREDLLSGDLIFWPGHVAIYCGENRIIHASRLRGYVTVDSLDPNVAYYRSDLADSISAIRRIELPK